MDWVGKVLDFVAKYFWALFVVAAFVLFVPDDAAQQIGLTELREKYKGLLWVGLVFSGALWAGAAFRWGDEKLSTWLKSRSAAKARAEQRRAKQELIKGRLQSLDKNERLWLKYCLYHNTQTLSAQRADRVAQSLSFKGILAEGSGHILDLPFHIVDDVWQYLKQNESQFLSPEEHAHPQFAQELERFKIGRHAH